MVTNGSFVASITWVIRELLLGYFDYYGYFGDASLLGLLLKYLDFFRVCSFKTVSLLSDRFSAVFSNAETWKKMDHFWSNQN